METLKIGQVAKAAAVAIDTIRFYEREKLIASPPRNSSGYRVYPPETVTRVRFIRTAKDLGFSLKEIRELLALRIDPVASCAEVKALAEQKISAVEVRIRALKRMQRTLRNLITACAHNTPTSACPILDSLEKEKRP